MQSGLCKSKAKRYLHYIKSVRIGLSGACKERFALQSIDYEIDLGNEVIYI